MLCSASFQFIDTVASLWTETGTRGKTVEIPQVQFLDQWFVDCAYWLVLDILIDSGLQFGRADTVFTCQVVPLTMMMKVWVMTTTFLGPGAMEQIVASCHRSWRNREGVPRCRADRGVMPQTVAKHVGDTACAMGCRRQFLRLWTSLCSCSDVGSRDSGVHQIQFFAGVSGHSSSQQRRVRFMRGYGIFRTPSTWTLSPWGV